MRAQITGLEAAQKNVKDGISLVKTGEGAMQEVQDMLKLSNKFRGFANVVPSLHPCSGTGFCAVLSGIWPGCQRFQLYHSGL